MITRGIVEKLLTPYEIKVRIPLLDRIPISSVSTDVDSLNTAVVCTLPRCDVNLRPGDIVFVGFEDNQYDQVVILGVLYKETLTKESPNQQLQNLNVFGEAVLPQQTSIGDVTANNIKCLQGCKINIQQEIEMLKIQLENLKTQVGGT